MRLAGVRVFHTLPTILRWLHSSFDSSALFHLMSMQTTTCSACGQPLTWPPMCYGAPAPWRGFGITDAEFPQRVELNADLCVVDWKHFFIRGHVEIRVSGLDELFAWSVWCSLSEASFRRVCSRWDSPGREHDAPMFGWLMTALPCYTGRDPVKTMVHTRPVGQVPLIEVDPDDELGREQQSGISMERVLEFAQAITGDGGPKRCGCAT
ncbi:MAG: DUF2199 domain-containing protein [Phycisphaerales bacterium]